MAIRQPSAWGLFKVIATALLLAMIPFIISQFDPFGLRTDSERASDEIVQYLTSPFYGRGLGGRAPIGQGRISVVYIDERALDRLGKLWPTYPPSYGNQADLLGDVVQSHVDAPPRAIFIDFIFLQKGPKPEEFDGYSRAIADLTHAGAWSSKPACESDNVIKAACIEAAGGIPVILGGVGGAGSAAYDGLAALKKVAVIVSLRVNTLAYPLLGKTDSPAALLYVADCLRTASTGAGSVAAAPACGGAAGSEKAKAYSRLAAAAAALVNPHGDPRAAGDARAAAQEIRETLGGKFAVTWSAQPDLGSAGVPGLNALSYKLTGDKSPCPGADAAPNSLGATWSQFGRQLRRELIRWPRPGGGHNSEKPEGPPLAACPYALSLSYGDLVTGPPLTASLRRRLFDDKLILIGGQFADSSDWVRTPVHGQLPGVQYHAMALDNLLETAGHVPRVDEGSSTRAHALEAALVFVMVILGGLQKIARNTLEHDDTRPRDTPPLRRRFARRAMGLNLQFLAVKLVLFVLVVMFAIHVQSPINWIEVFTIAVGHGLLSERETLGEDLLPFFEFPLFHKLFAPFRALSLRNEILSPARPQSLASSPIPEAPAPGAEPCPSPTAPTVAD